MNSLLFVRIRKRTQAASVIMLIVLLPFCFGFLSELLSLPYAVRYLLDPAWMFLLFLLVYFRQKTQPRQVRPLLFWSVAFFAVSAVLYVLNFRSALSYLWGVRNNFRFYPFFFAVCLFQTERDIEDYLKLFDALFWVNAAVSLIQYFVLGLQRDNLGGLFGTAEGCNSYTNIFFVIIVTKSLVCFLNRREGFASCISKCAMALCIAAMAELKFFFVEFAVIVSLSVLLTRFSRRSLLIAFGGLLALTMGTAALTALFPEFSNVMSLKALYQIASSRKGYTSSGDLNRLTVIPLVNQWFLRDPVDRLFGLGLGNCDTSSFDFLNSSFYKRYHYSHYSWLSTAFIYLEMGCTGLVFLFGFFFLNFLLTTKLKKRKTSNIPYCQMGQILSVCAVLILIYNSSMRMEAAYMLYLFLAFPYVKQDQSRT